MRFWIDSIYLVFPLFPLFLFLLILFSFSCLVFSFFNLMIIQNYIRTEVKETEKYIILIIS